jgi:4-amino-4-deoxy-L-arabinose transferase-like glycosyltransferase
MTAGRAVLAIIVAGTLVRLALAAGTGLGYDESYMVGNARILALGYVDHPPLHVWMAGLAMRAFHSEAAIVVRLPFVLLFAGSTWLMYRLAGRLFGERAGLWAVIAFSLAPVFTLSHATWVLPDGPLIFFLLASAGAGERAIFGASSPRAATLGWLLAGVCTGLALLSKYNAAFFPAAVLVFLVTAPAARRHLATAGPWLAAAMALVVFSPVLVWNAEHGFIGFAFQAARASPSGLHPGFFGTDIAGQALYLTPWLFVPMAVSLLRALRGGPRDQRGWLMALAAAGPIAFFTLLSLTARGLPHWPMPGWLFAFPLFGRETVLLFGRQPVFARRYMIATAAIFVVMLGAFGWQATRGGLLPLPLAGPLAARDPTVDLVDWSELRSAVADRQALGQETAVASPSWLYAGKASYALGPGVPVLCLCANPQQFAFRADQNQWSGRDVMVVIPAGKAGLRDLAARYFDSLEPLPPVFVHRNGAIVLTLDLWVGRNLHFPPR